MKRVLILVLALAFLFSFSACSTKIPTSAEAKEKMQALGYDVDLSVQYGSDVAVQGIQQVTFLFCDKDDDFLQVYFFTNKEDTDKFYKENQKSLEYDVEVIHKNRYSIYRGTKAATEDFLS